MSIVWEAEDDEEYEWEPEEFETPSRQELVAEALQREDGLDYHCYDCGNRIPGIPYIKIEGPVLAYEGCSSMPINAKWLCTPCWRIHCLGAQVRW